MVVGDLAGGTVIAGGCSCLTVKPGSARLLGLALRPLDCTHHHGFRSG